MITGKSGYFDLTGSISSFTLRVNWSEEYDEITNTSLVRIDSLQVKSTKYANGYFPDGLVKINGQTVITMNSYYGTHSLGIKGLGPWYTIETAGDEVASGSAEVVHETDGSKSVVIEVAKNRLSGGCRFIGGTSGEDNGWYVNGSQTVELTDIPRASTVTASDADIGAAAKIAITKRSAAYTHSVAFSFGSLSGYLTKTGEITDTETRFSRGSISFPLPESFYYEIPNAPSGVCTLTVRTYSGDTQIGEDQTAAFTVRANQANCAPILSGTAVDTDAATLALTGDQTVLVKNASTALCTLSAQPRYGATITERSVNGQSIEGDTVTLSPFTADSVVFRVVDSRGFETQYACPVTVIGYYAPTLTASAARTDPTSGNAVITVRGSCYPGSFGEKGNTLQVKYTVDGVETAQTLSIQEDGTYSAQLPVAGLDYESEHTVSVWVADALQSTEVKTLWIGKGIPVFDWGESDFQFHVPVNFEKGLTMPRALLADLLYPVGSIYMSVQETDPGTLFGGTWERIKDRFLLAAGDANGLGETGGEAAHTLTAEEMPSHNHGFLDYWSTAYGSSSKYKSVALNGDGEGADEVKNDRSYVADTGGGQPHNNMPPYLAVCVWKRTM